MGDFGTSTGSGSAVVANAGAGRYKDRVVWVNWGADGATLANNASVTTWQQVGPTTRLEVTCSLSGVGTNALRAYRPGDWSADGLPQLYRTSGSTNTLVSGITQADSGTDTFTVSCANGARLATYTDTTFTTLASTSAVTLAGLVVADAESTNGSEYVYATPTPAASTTWKLIDAYGGTCQSSYYAALGTTAGKQLRLTASGECSGTNQYSATAVAFAQGASSLAVTLYGTGLSAVAIGYIAGVDYGDAPASYGLAGGVVQPTWTGGTTLTTNRTTVVSGGTVQTARLATMAAPATVLGAQAFPNTTPPFSADASGDTGWAVPPSATVTADEDAISAPGPITYYRGVTTSYTLAGVDCVNGAAVKGWIDWDRSGTFDADEASSTVTCGSSGTASLTFAVPSDVPDGVASGGDRTFIRLQTALDASQLGPTSVVAAGEVEDWPVLLRVPKLQVTKTTPATVIPASGNVVYTVTATNVGNGDYTTSNKAYLYDNYAAAVDDASYTGVTSIPTGVTNDSANSLLAWSGALTAGSSAAVTLTMTVKTTPGDLVMTNVARVSNTALAASGVTCSAGSADETAKVCATNTLYRAGLTVTKSAYRATDGTQIASGAAIAPGTSVYWKYTVKNTGSGPVSGISLSDVATDVRTDASGTTTATSSPTITCPGYAPGTTVTGMTLAAGASITCQSETRTIGGS